MIGAVGRVQAEDAAAGLTQPPKAVLVVAGHAHRGRNGSTRRHGIDETLDLLVQRLEAVQHTQRTGPRQRHAHLHPADVGHGRAEQRHSQPGRSERRLWHRLSAVRQ